MKKIIRDFIVANPGCTGRAIARHCGVHNAQLHPALNILQDEGEIKRKGNTCAAKWYPAMSGEFLP